MAVPMTGKVLSVYKLPHFCASFVVFHCLALAVVHGTGSISRGGGVRKVTAQVCRRVACIEAGGQGQAHPAGLVSESPFNLISPSDEHACCWLILTVMYNHLARVCINNVQSHAGDCNFSLVV